MGQGQKANIIMSKGVISGSAQSSREQLAMSQKANIIMSKGVISGSAPSSREQLAMGPDQNAHIIMSKPPY